LVSDYETKSGGIRIIQNGTEVQMVTSPENSQIIQEFLKQEVSQELTPASLETLSIIAYRGPIFRRELEQIRGVNCSIILRNLLIRGLIIELTDNKAVVSTVENEDGEGDKIYQVSLDFIKHLGVNDLKELPDYEKLNKDVPLSSLIEQGE
jgi:segregation and condensation protein B